MYCEQIYNGPLGSDQSECRYAGNGLELYFSIASIMFNQSNAAILPHVCSVRGQPRTIENGRPIFPCHVSALAK